MKWNCLWFDPIFLCVLVSYYVLLMAFLFTITNAKCCFIKNWWIIPKKVFIWIFHSDFHIALLIFVAADATLFFLGNIVSKLLLCVCWRGRQPSSYCRWKGKVLIKRTIYDFIFIRPWTEIQHAGNKLVTVTRF